MPIPVRPLLPLLLMVALGATAAGAADPTPAPPAHAQMQGHDARHAQMHALHGAATQMPPQAVSSMPTEAGQSAFAAIQEIVTLLEADPATDWERVDLEALRGHLADMERLVVYATVRTTRIPGGFSAVVTGEGPVRAAIERMVPTHAQFVNGYRGWSVVVKPEAGGVRMVATAEQPAEVAHLRGLGFIGVMASQAHHQPHHWQMATGAGMGRAHP